MDRYFAPYPFHFDVANTFEEIRQQCNIRSSLLTAVANLLKVGVNVVDIVCHLSNTVCIDFPSLPIKFLLMSGHCTRNTEV